MDFWTLETLGLEAAALVHARVDGTRDLDGGRGATALSASYRSIPSDGQRIRRARLRLSRSRARVRSRLTCSQVTREIITGIGLFSTSPKYPRARTDDRRVGFRKLLVIGAELGFERQTRLHQSMDIDVIALRRPLVHGSELHRGKVASGRDRAPFVLDARSSCA